MDTQDSNCEAPHGCWLWEDHDWQPCAGVPATDRGFRHGMSVFETVALRSGSFLFLSEHIAKLRQAALSVGLRIPPVELQHSLITRDWATISGLARIYVTAGDGDFRVPLNQGRILLLIEERTPLMSDDIKIRLHPERFTPIWPGLKTGNYWNHIHAWREARQAGFDDAVLVNPSSHVISATMANLFAVIDGLLMTPRPASGARVGVIRDWVTDRWDVVLTDFHPEELREATEIFLTNSGHGIRVVTQLDSQPLPDQTIGRSLQADYAAMLDFVS